MTSRLARGSSALVVLALAALGVRAETQATPPRPVRNDVVKAGREILVLRNHELKPGGHEAFYQFSRDSYWPFFERLGARVVGQWKVTAPDTAGAKNDDVYRLVRYASFEHWQATRQGPDVGLGGNGPAWETGQQGLGDRGGLQTGSKGAYFLEGLTAPDSPRFMPGLAEQYERVDGERPAATDEKIPVRAGAAVQGREIVELRYQRIRKGGFDRFSTGTLAAVWPWEEKLGARAIGQWKVVHPPAPNRTGDSAEFDEVITMTRYASAAHRQAMGPDVAVYMGGNGPDWRAWHAALAEQRAVTIETRSELMEGHLFQSVPVYLPGVTERYRAVK